MIGKRKCPGEVRLWHVASNAVDALLARDVRGFVRMATQTHLVVNLRPAALRVSVGRVAGGACNFAAQKAGAFHQTQRLETHIADIVVFPRNRLEAVTLATQLNLRGGIELAGGDRLASAIGMLFSPGVAAGL